MFLFKEFIINKTLKFNLENLNRIYSFVCKLLSYGFIVDNDLVLMNIRLFANVLRTNKQMKKQNN
jgi:hypothetical protein